MDYSAIEKALREEGVYVDLAGLLDPTASILGNGNDSLFKSVLTCFWEGITGQKETFITLLVLCIVFGLISQLAEALEQKEFREYGYFIYFVCSASVCISLFMECFQIVENLLESVIRYMQVLIPVYSMGVLLTSGKQTAAGYYGMILGAIFLVELILSAVCLPCTKLFMAVQLANAGTGEMMLSKFCQLIYDCMNWGLKILVTLLCGLQLVRALILSPLGELTEHGVYKTMMMIPGVGQMTGGCLEMLLGSFKVMKNSIGAAGLIGLFLLMLTPCTVLLGYLLAARLLEAVMQPVVKETMLTMIGGCGQGIELLLKVALYTFLLLFVSLAILTTLS